MSKVNKRKHVMNEALWDDYELPKENQSIVKVVKSNGNNLHEITTPTGEEYLVSMPTKFRKNIWVKRGDYILVEPIPEGDKVKGEIVKIMNKDSIKHYKENNLWPKEFEDDKKEIDADGDDEIIDADGDDELIDANGDDELIDSDSDDELFVNTNRKPVLFYSDSESDDSDSSSDSDYNSDYNSDSDEESNKK